MLKTYSVYPYINPLGRVSWYTIVYPHVQTHHDTQMVAEMNLPVNAGSQGNCLPKKSRNQT